MMMGGFTAMIVGEFQYLKLNLLILMMESRIARIWLEDEDGLGNAKRFKQCIKMRAIKNDDKIAEFATWVSQMNDYAE